MNRWYSYDPEDAYSTHDTHDEAREAAEASLEYHRDRASDGWHENTSDIEWGLLVPYGEARQINVRETTGGEFDCLCDYEIHSAASGDPLEEACRRLERLASERDALMARNATLEHALKCLLLSRDAAWTGGHDWHEAVEQACTALGVAPEDQ